MAEIGERSFAALLSWVVAHSACPTCQKPVQIPTDDEPMGVFPFCSDRCKLIDLGRWLDGRYQIPVVEKDESDESTSRSDG